MNKNLPEALQSLSPDQLTILMFMSVLYKTLPANDLADILKAARVRNEEGNYFYPMDIMRMMHELAQKQIVFNEYTQYAVQPQHLIPLFRLAQQRVDFPTWRNRVDLTYSLHLWGRRNDEEVVRRCMFWYVMEGMQSNFKSIYSSIKTEYVDYWSSGFFFEPFVHGNIKASSLPLELRKDLGQIIVNQSIEGLAPFEHLVSHLESHEDLSSVDGESLRSQLFLFYVLSAQFTKAEVLITQMGKGWQKELSLGLMYMLNDNHRVAMKHFEESTKSMKTDFGKSDYFVGDFRATMHALLLEVMQPKGHFEKVQKHIEHLQSNFYSNALGGIMVLGLFNNNNQANAKMVHDDLLGKKVHPIEAWIFGLCSYWTQNKITVEVLDALTKGVKDGIAHGYNWLVAEFSLFLAIAHPNDNLQKKYQEIHTEYEEYLAKSTFFYLVEKKEDWERAFTALENISAQKLPKSAAQQLTRLVWYVDFNNKEISVKQQKITKGGRWSKGRLLSWEKLKSGEVSDLTPQDLKVVGTIYKEKSNYYHDAHLNIDFSKALPALVGHPNLYLAINPEIKVDLEEAEPQLLVEQKEGSYVMQFDVDASEEGVIINQQTPTRYSIINVQAKHAEISQYLNGQLTIPGRAKHQLEDLMVKLGRVISVQSTLQGGMSDLPTIKGDATTFVHLLPVDESYRIEFFVKPFKKDGPYLKPSMGRDKIVAEVNNAQVMAARDFGLESQMATEVIKACPTLQRFEFHNYAWEIDEVEDCLNVLLELAPLREKGQIVLEHPKGERLKMSGSLDWENLGLAVGKKADWFEVTGSVVYQDYKVLTFKELLEKVSGSDSKFVQVSDGQYFAITDDLRKRIRELASVTQSTKDDLRLSPLAVNVFDQFAEQLEELEVDNAWKESLHRLNDSKRIKPTVPSTFEAELRPYQMDGFKWLSQLAYWGVGACLADDMGLGKTVQGLALILSRAKDGPALVVAPASVTRNWMREVYKFAPTLNPMLFGEGNRQKMIDNLKPNDILMVSYGLLPIEEELLASVKFTTIVLDEAQAIKNKASKRSKAARALQGDFKIITTGTPIENNLSELWSLFSFINPGLLGSHNAFNDNFATPIQKDDDFEKRQHLHRLLKPFILRRRKTEVLEELPAKTEVTLTVELSEDERAFYEAARQNAVDKIQNTDEGGAKRFQVLAELTKLRQAACHPTMVDPTINIGSSKLNLFADTIRELIAGGHKALVFSQFVKHLTLVREWVESEGINYQYLDGSTPGKARDKAVTDFQNGEGDIFLISLKAGGTGLNLTAADYVIHLDPWWNPAVEDQASDRAYRMGQTRPVTVYRLVSENTIEEKIVKLHKSKRDLADSLLTGTEASAKLSPDDLLDLIKMG